MALSVPVIPTNGEGGSGTDAASYTTGSIAFANNKLYLLSICSGLVGSPGTPTVTGGGLTWVQIDTTTRSNCRVTMFRALKTTGATTGALTIDFAGTTQSNCLWQVTEWTGMPTTGTDGSDAVVQHGAANQAGTHALINLPNAVTTDGATFGAVFVNSASYTATADTGFTELGTTATFTSPSIRRSTEYAEPGIRAVGMVIGGSTNNWGIVGCEVVAAAAATQTLDSAGLGIASGETMGAKGTVSIAGGTVNIVFRSASQNAGNDATTLDVTPPTGIQLGDFILAVVVLQADNNVATVPTGFQLARPADRNAVADNTGVITYLYWKSADSTDVAASSAGTPYTWKPDNSADMAIGIVAYSGVNTTTPFDAIALNPNESTSGSPVAPTVTSSVNGDVLLVVSALNPRLAYPGTGSFSTPAGFTERVDVSPAAVSGLYVRALLAIDEKSIPTSGTATGTTAVTPSNTGKNLAYSILLVAGSSTVTTAQGPVQYLDSRPTTTTTTTTTTPTTTVQGCMLGYYGDDLTTAQAEGITKKNFACVRMYHTPGDWPQVKSSVIQEVNSGRLVVVSHNPPDLAGVWDTIANTTTYDADIDKIATVYKNLGKEVVVIFRHEPHVHCKQVKPGTTSTDNGTAAQYRAATQKWVTRFRNIGATNVKFGYCAVTSSWAVPEDGTTNTLYAGDSYIDVLCHDEYNWYHSVTYDKNGNVSGADNRTWKEFEDIWGKCLDLCVSHNKPLIIGEYASDIGHGNATPTSAFYSQWYPTGIYNRDSWIKAMGDWIQNRDARAKKYLIGMCWFHSSPPTRDWRFLNGPSAPEGLQGFKDAFITDPATGQAQKYFLSTPKSVTPNTSSTGGGGGGTTTTTTPGLGIASEETFVKGNSSIAFTSGTQYIDSFDATDPIQSEEVFGYGTVVVTGGALTLVSQSGISTVEAFGYGSIYLADVAPVKIPPVLSQANALTALYAPSTQVVRQVTIYEEDGTTVWYAAPPVTAGNVSVDMNRDERRVLDITFDNSDAVLNDYPGGFWYDKVIKVSRGVDYGAVDSNGHSQPYWSLLGSFMIDKIESQNFPHTVHVTGRDYTKKLMLSKFKYNTAFPPGTYIPDIIQGIVFAAGIPAEKQTIYRGTDEKFTLKASASGKSASDTDTVFERGTTRWAAIKQLAQSCSCAVYFDPTGQFIFEPFVDPYLTPASFVFSADQDNGTPNLVTWKKSVNDSRLFNVVICEGTGTGDADTPFAIYSNTEPNSPTSIAQIGERIQDPIINPLWITDDQCLDAAKTMLQIAALEEFTLSFESIVVPWLDVNRIVTFTNPQNPYDPTSFLLTSLNIPLALQAMGSEARRVIRVADPVNHP